MKSLIRIFLLFVLLSGIFIAAIRAQDIKTIDSLTQLLETDITDRARVDTWNLLAGEYNTSDALKTADYTSKTIALSKKINYLEGISDTYYRIGVSTAINGDHNKATELYTQALISAQEASYKKGEGNAYNGLGIIHANQGQLPQSAGVLP
ncbi:MAG TPA: hypothetical protein ACFCUD_09010 [Cyclobacteriaceae bacterium]